MNDHYANTFVLEVVCTLLCIMIMYNEMGEWEYFQLHRLNHLYIDSLLSAPLYISLSFQSMNYGAVYKCYID